MLLNEIGKSPSTTLTKINTYLESNYKFKIAEGVQYHDLVAIMEQIQDEIIDLKMSGEDSKSSPEISKRLLVLEGIKSLKEFAMIQFQSPLLDKVVKNLVDFVVDTFHISGYQGHTDFDKAVEKAMDEYRSSRYRFPDDMIEQRVRQEAMQQLQASMPSPTTPQPSPVMMEDDDGVEVDDSEQDEIEESKWISTDPAKRGMFNGKSKSDIDSEKSSLKKKDAAHAGHVSDADKTKMHELEFASRAKSKGGLEENDPWGSVGKRASAHGGHSITDLNPRQKELLGMQDQESEKPVPMVRGKDGRMVPDPFAAHAAQRKQGIVR